MNDQKNTILAIVLSAIVLIGWQYFIGMPQMERQRQEALLRQQQAQQAKPPQAAPSPAAPAGAAPRPPGQADVTTPAEQKSREAALGASERIPIETPSVKGSIALKGGRLDDISLSRYHETVDPNSPAIVLLSPSGSPHPFYAEFGWVGGAGANVKAPGPDTVWQREGAGPLTPERPIALVYDNGEGLKFRRTISVDDKYLFTLRDEVANSTAAPVTLYPYALISRHGLPQTSGYYILHEGLIGVMGDQGLQEVTYKTIEDKKSLVFKATDAWMGITDKYWAATLLPNTDAQVQAH
ncbi:MAG TPA: membrane protein insertase YidC, partial [Xanthobacteraceae bacterium]|nr:membrane protein insertase YidC [Xanthobacteraceae bacterium]